MATSESFSIIEANRTLKLNAAKEVYAIIPDAYDTTERVVKFAMLSWDTGSLMWVKFTGGGGGGGGAVTIADGADTVEGFLADAAVITDAAGTVSGKLRGLVKWAYERMPTSLGQKAMAASFPVVIASDQSAVAISGTITANAGTNLNTSALNLEVTQALVKAKTDNLDVLLSTRLKPADTLAAVTSLTQFNGVAIALNTGLRAAGVLRVTQATDDVNHIDDNAGTLTVDAPVGTPVFVRLSDGAAALIAQKTMALSVPVVLASDQSVIPVNGDIDHDVANTLKNIQVAGNANPVDVPPTAVSANGDRVRIWADKYGSPVIRRRKIRESYTVVFRLAEAAARLDQTFTHVANTNKQWATLHHTAGATKEARLQKCLVFVTSQTVVAPQGIIELRQISAAPATGNPAITPTPRRRGGTAAEAIALYLPTTAGTEAGVNTPLAHFICDDAVSVATAAFQHPQQYESGGIVLYDASLEDDDVLPPTLPVATLDGWAVVSRFTGASVTRLTVVMTFIEEIP